MLAIIGIVNETDDINFSLIFLTYCYYVNGLFKYEYALSYLFTLWHYMFAYTCITQLTVGYLLVHIKSTH